MALNENPHLCSFHVKLKDSDNKPWLILQRATSGKQQQQLLLMSVPLLQGLPRFRLKSLSSAEIPAYKETNSNFQKTQGLEKSRRYKQP